MDFDKWFSSPGVFAFMGVALFLLCVTSVLRIFRLALMSDLRRIPGPWYAKWTRVWLKWYIINGQRSQYIHVLHTKYGQFVRISPREVAISNLDAYKTIHKVGSGFNKSDWYQKFNEGPPGVFAMTDPKQHASRRRLFAQAFSNSSIQTYEPIVRERVTLAVMKIKRDATAGCADILKWFTFMATDVSGELSFGQSFNMLQLEKKTAYIHDLETALMISGISVELGFLVKLLKILPISGLQHAFSVVSRLEEYGHQAILNLRNHATVQTGTRNPHPSIFTKMIDRDKNPELSDKDIEHEASNLIVAGSDTTAITLTYTVWALLRPINKIYRDRLIEELKSESIGAEARVQLSTLPYMDAVIKEGLRLYGAAPGSLPRVVPKGGIDLGGYVLPEGTTVSTQAFSLHRNSTNFPQPEKFNPERWLEATKEMNDAFAAFGSGSRSCLGIHLAMSELRIGIAVFFRECPSAEILSSTTDESMEFVNHFLIAPKGGKCEIAIR